MPLALHAHPTIIIIIIVLCSTHTYCALTLLCGCSFMYVCSVLRAKNVDAHGGALE